MICKKKKASVIWLKLAYLCFNVQGVPEKNVFRNFIKERSHRWLLSFLFFSQVTEMVDDVLEIADWDVGFAFFAFEGGNGVAETVYGGGDRDTGGYGLGSDPEVVVSGLHA